MNNKHYTKPRGYGAYTPKRLISHIKYGPQAEKGWLRPLPYHSIIERLKQAWDVLAYRADALYWKEHDINKEKDL